MISRQANSKTLQYCDVTKPLTLQVDVLEKGLGAVLYQDKGPVACACKAMNDTQQNYAQIEKELLAIVFGCKRFHQYIYGKHVVIETDHKPLEAIFLKPLSQAPSRLQRMMLQLQGYDIELLYKKGSEMYIVDALSRAFPEDIITDNFEREIAEEKCIHLMSTEAYVIDCKLKEIKERMYTDNQVRLLAIQMKQGWPSNKSLVPLEIKEYYQYREMLSKKDGLVYSGHAILIPPTVRRDMLPKLQKSHQGIVKTKQ